MATALPNPLPSHLPEPLTGATKVLEATLKDTPTPEALAAWLGERGLDTSGWGSGDTKTVKKFWQEIDLQEAGAEVWRKADGTLQPVRVTHVLRAKVTSRDHYERGIFLFNTWQQFGDGRTRTRNGLLSEKLTLGEMPLEDNLHEVCQRAVTEEEMQRVVESACKIGPGRPAPEYDPNYECPLRVVDEKFVDHIIEVEISKSYPGLLTMYHLYTVEIICSGLPIVDLNTLEFDHPDKNGKRKLKYIHAWVWLEWGKIQRYLFEGSQLKERKKAGDFKDHVALKQWLSQFSLSLSMWGKETFKSVESLWKEIETEETQLELWGRQDGVPLLVRVAHVLQVEVHPIDPRLNGKFLLNTWTQMPNGTCRTENRMLAHKLNITSDPYDNKKFAEEAKNAVQEQLAYLVDTHFQLNPDRLPTPEESPKNPVNVVKCKFKEQRCEVEESPSYKGLLTMYQIYCMSAECDGLPVANFASLDFRPDGKSGQIKLKYAHGWSWVSWSQALGIVNDGTKAGERRVGGYLADTEDSARRLDEAVGQLAGLMGAMQKICRKVSAKDNDAIEAARHAIGLHRSLLDLQERSSKIKRENQNSDSRAAMLPPSMISKMAESTLADKGLLEEAQWQREQEAKRLQAQKYSSSEYK
jgi:hypothetical protein